MAGVTADAEAVLREALGLSLHERANVAAELLASLEPAEDAGAVESAWAAEIEDRIHRASVDGFPGEDWAVIRQRLTDEFTG